MSVSSRTNLIFDSIVFLAFLVLANPDLTGMSVHEWLGVAFLAALLTHLVLHWEWIVNVTTTFFKKLWHSSRLNYVVNLAFLVLMSGALFSGLMIFDEKTVNSFAWKIFTGCSQVILGFLTDGHPRISS